MGLGFSQDQEAFVTWLGCEQLRRGSLAPGSVLVEPMVL